MKTKCPSFPKPIYIHGVKEGTDGPVEFEVAMQWNDTYTENLYSLRQQHRHTPRRNPRHRLFDSADPRPQQYIKSHNLLKSDKIAVTGEDMREGLTAVISSKCPILNLKGRPNSGSAIAKSRSVVQQIVGEELTIFLDENPVDCQD